MRRVSDKGGRVTLRELERAAVAMSKASGKRFRIDTMLGGSRIVSEVGEHGGIRDESYRMSKGALMRWIWAWWAGFNTALATMEARGVNLKIYLDAKAESGLCPKCDSLLEDISVFAPGMWENETGPKDWWAVCNEEGIIAYFGREVDAYFYRLALINARLNKIGEGG